MKISGRRKRSDEPVTKGGRKRRQALGSAARMFAEKIGSNVNGITWDRNQPARPMTGSYSKDSGNIRVYALWTCLLDSSDCPETIDRVSRLLAHEVWHGAVEDYSLGLIEEGCVQLLALRDGREIAISSELLTPEQILALPLPNSHRGSYEREVNWVIGLANLVNEDPCVFAERVLRSENGSAVVLGCLAGLVANDPSMECKLVDSCAGVTVDDNDEMNAVLERVWKSANPFTQMRDINELVQVHPSTIMKRAQEFNLSESC